MVASFSYQIQYEYYGVNRYVYIEGITLEKFSAPEHTEKSTTPKSHTQHAVCSLLFSDDSKQDAAKTIAHSKRIIELLNKHNIMSATLRAYHYRCDTAL